MTALASHFHVSSRTIVALHEARTISELVPALFKFTAEALPQETLVLMLRPQALELRSYSSRPEFQHICDHQTVNGLCDDIWQPQSPKSPDVPIVRHSLYTPKTEFQKSVIYRQIMEKFGCEYGASLVTWKKNIWLGSLTIFRTRDQGDFLDEEMPALSSCHLHFQSIINRIAILNEEKLGSHSLESFIWTLPTAALILDWDLKPLYWNAAGQELGAEWKLGFRTVATRRSRPATIPHEIESAIEIERPALCRMKTNSPGTPSMIGLAHLHHPRNKELTAEIKFLPSKSLALSKGTFLIIFHRRQNVPDDRDSYDRLANLSRREREVVLLAAAGKNSGEIARKLGTSSVTVRTQLTKAYRKLAIHSRLELMSMFAQNPLLKDFPVRNHGTPLGAKAASC